MSGKLVHVKAYTKDDGTKVKEHYRGGVSEQTTNFEAPVLEGGVSMDIYPEEEGIPLPETLGQASEAVQVVIAMAQMASGIAIEGIKVASSLIYAIKNLDEIGAAQLGLQMS